MAEHASEASVKVTASQRAHPAIRAVARACIALARWQREQQGPSNSEPTTDGTASPPATSVSSVTLEQPAASDRGRCHD
jgi:hypothetical protein